MGGQTTGLVISREYFPRVSNPTYRNVSDRLQVAMREVGSPVEPYTEHLFGDGTCARVMHVNAGDTVVGKVHRRACINILLSGVIRVTSDDMQPTTMEAPYWYVSGAGVRKCIYAVTDAIFMNVLANEDNSRDVAAIIDRWASADYENQLEAP